MKQQIKHFFSRSTSSIHNHPFIWAVVACFLYLIIFQFNFITTGDAWAESFAEYLDESLRKGVSEVFAQNWAGYLTVAPSAIAKLYVHFGGPIGYADYFFRLVVIGFAVISASLVALKMNRYIIKNDYIRIFFAISILAVLGDVASFSFINVWYIGFIPVILYCLYSNKLGTKSDVLMGSYGALISLTKPLLILMPLIVYRMVKTRQYAGSTILLIATSIQSYQILFNDKRQIVSDSNFDILTALGALFTGSTTAVFKLFQSVPGSLLLLFIVAVGLCVVAWLLWQAKGVWLALWISLVFAFCVYTYALAPDGPAYYGIELYRDMASFNLKSQREILINSLLLLALFIGVDYLVSKYRTLSFVKIPRQKTSVFVIPICLLILCLVHRPIDTTSAGVTNQPLDAFRSQLNTEQPSCVPLAPSALFFPNANWSFSYKGTCQTLTHDLNIFKPDFQHMESPIKGQVLIYDTKAFRLQRSELQAIVIPIVNRADDAPEVTINEVNSGKKYSTTALGNGGDIQLITFNTTGLSSQDKYKFIISSKSTGLYGANYLEQRSLVTYPYFLTR